MTAAEGCANGFPDISVITAKASKTTNGAKLATSLSLSRSFTCSGTLTGLVLGVDVRTETASRSLYPEVALWRPTDSDDDGGVYEKVHRSERMVKLTAANFSTSGAFDYLIDPPLDFRSNDVLGWDQPDLVDSVVRMYTVDRQVSSGSDDDRRQTTIPVLLLYPVTGEVQLYTCSSDGFL